MFKSVTYGNRCHSYNGYHNKYFNAALKDCADQIMMGRSDDFNLCMNKHYLCNENNSIMYPYPYPIYVSRNIYNTRPGPRPSPPRFRPRPGPRPSPPRRR